MVSALQSHTNLQNAKVFALTCIWDAGDGGPLSCYAGTLLLTTLQASWLFTLTAILIQSTSQGLRDAKTELKTT